MKSSKAGGPYSPVSISKELWPWCMFVIFVLTVAWTALIAWAEVSGGISQDVLNVSIAIGTKTAAGVPLIIIYSIIIVIVGNFILGGGIMVTARATRDYLYDKIKRQRERLREEGLLQGREALAAEVLAWNRRRLEAESRGESFDEPPPGA